MKNKRWKRQAKRLMGKCIIMGNRCGSRCNTKNECDKALGGGVPILFSIRELEQLCKGGN